VGSDGVDRIAARSATNQPIERIGFSAARTIAEILNLFREVQKDTGVALVFVIM
jgi:hypothetical protein